MRVTARKGRFALQPQACPSKPLERKKQMQNPHQTLRAGKLPMETLGRMLSAAPVSDPRVALGPAVGEDAALVDFGDRYLVAKTDPITFATDLIGWYMVNVNANDIAVMGGAPKWLLATLLLPEGTSEARAADIFAQTAAACAELGVSLIGGHTEITVGLDKPIAVGAMLGEVDKADAVLSAGVRPGDALILTKGIALEGASVLAREAGERLARAGVGEDTIRRAADFLFDPGIGVVRDAEILRRAVPVHAMRDPTEGGLSGALYELAAASGVGADIDADAIPVIPECRAICAALGLDPLGLIASGALLAAVAPEDAPKALAALRAEGVSAAEIGRATDRHSRAILRRPNAPDSDFPTFKRDELARFFGG